MLSCVLARDEGRYRRDCVCWWGLLHKACGGGGRPPPPPRAIPLDIAVQPSALSTSSTTVTAALKR